VTAALSIQVDDGVSKALAGLAARVGDLGPALDEIGSSQVAEVQNRFESGKGPDGGAWRPLSAVTLAKRGGSAKMLRDTGALYDSQVHSVSGTGVKVGTNSAIGGIHQFGGQAGRGRKVTIPARPYLGISDAGRKEILAILADHLEAGASS
jgi:phage virion morphogenesis protein